MAARPMITDDARIVDAKACQVESWVRFNQTESNQYWAVPACNPTGNLEISVGGAVGREPAGPYISDTLLQLKTLMRPLTTNGFGWGLALGRARNPRLDPAGNLLGNVYGYLPASFSLRDDAVVVHVNVGFLRDRREGRTNATWGVGTEIRLRENLQLIAETFGQGTGQRPFGHAGLRFWVVPNRVQIDATYGNQFVPNSGSRWFTIGLRLISPPFLP